MCGKDDIDGWIDNANGPEPECPKGDGEENNVKEDDAKGDHVNTTVQKPSYSVVK